MLVMGENAAGNPDSAREGLKIVTADVNSGNPPAPPSFPGSLFQSRPRDGLVNARYIRPEGGRGTSTPPPLS